MIIAMIIMVMVMTMITTLTMIVTFGEGRGTEFTCTTYTTENSSMRKRDVEHESDTMNIFYY